MPGSKIYPPLRPVRFPGSRRPPFDRAALRLYTPSWRRSSSVLAGWSPGAPPTSSPDTWLVLADRPELREGIAARLAALCPGCDPVAVRSGAGFGSPDGRGYTVDPSRPEDFDRLFESLRRSGRRLRGVVHTGDGAWAAGSGWRGWRALIRAWGRCFPHTRGHLVTAGAGGHEVVGGDAAVPLVAPLSGLARLLPREEPALCQTAVDFPLRATPEEVAGWLAEEALGGAGNTPVVAYRGRHRWLPCFEPLPALPGRSDETAGRLRRGEHYLLTGGLGSFARAVAAHLALQGPVRLTLIDARAPRDLAPACRTDLTALTAALTAAGNEVAVLQADVTDPGELSGRIDRAVARFGEIHGVIHTARVSGPPQPLTEITEAGLAARLAPAVLGLPALRSALAGHRPGFCVVASGLAATLGQAGRGAEALADAFCEAFVQGAGAPWRSFAHEDRGDTAAALVRFLSLDGAAQAVAAVGNPLAMGAMGGMGGRVNGRQKTGAAAWANPAMPADDSGIRPPRDEMEARVAAVWQEVLGLDHLGIDDDFFLLGGSSLAGLRILSRLREGFGVELSLAALFEARTVEGLVRRLTGDAGDGGDAGLEEMARLLDRVEALSGEDLDALLAGEVARR